MSENESDIWRPFGMVQDEKTAVEALVPGIPAWLATSLKNWMVKRFTVTKVRNYYGEIFRDIYFNIPLLRRAERNCQVNIPFTNESSYNTVAENGVEQIFLSAGGEMQVLRIVDFVLIDTTKELADELNSILIESASAYHVGVRAGVRGLVPRLPIGVQENAERVMNSSGHAGALLQSAWNDVYSLSPKPSDAYVKAVKAVEQVTIRKVVPNQANANLGHVAGKLEADGDWYLPFLVEAEGSPSSRIVSDLIRLLWHGQHDRHAGGYQGPTTVSQEEAETAVSIAVILVQWFSEDRVQKRPPDAKRIVRKNKKP